MIVIELTNSFWPRPRPSALDAPCTTSTKTRSSPATPRARWPRCGATSGSSAPGGGCGSRWPKPKRSWACRSRTEQIAELRAHVDDIDFDAAEKYERKLRHDVMAHVHAYGDQCPAARPIIHLGATSCYVTDNTDLILIREALQMVAGRLAAVIVALADFAKQYRDLPTLSFTHLQPAQPTTVGRRACLWAYDLALDLAEVEHRIASLKARSVKGTTGTQASFLELFDGDHDKVRQLEQLVAKKMGFDATYAITGQTYSRKSRRPGARRARRHRRQRPQSGHRPADPGPSQGNRRAVREGPNRLLGDGVQAQPDASRADLRRWPGSR